MRPDVQSRGAVGFVGGVGDMGTRLLAGPDATSGRESLDAHVSRVGPLIQPERHTFFAALQTSGLLGHGGASFPLAVKLGAALGASQTSGLAPLLICRTRARASRRTLRTPRSASCVRTSYWMGPQPLQCSLERRRWSSTSTEVPRRLPTLFAGRLTNARWRDCVIHDGRYRRAPIVTWLASPAPLSRSLSTERQNRGSVPNRQQNLGFAVVPPSFRTRRHWLISP